jgi:hypothetical protein
MPRTASRSSVRFGAHEIVLPFEYEEIYRIEAEFGDQLEHDVVS